MSVPLKVITLTRNQFDLLRIPAWVAQLDARPTCDQEVAGSSPVGSATFFCGDMNLKYFLRSFFPSADSRRAVVSFWR